MAKTGDWKGTFSARVERAPLLKGIYLYTPYDQGFITTLKSIVPADMRSWDAEHRRWYIFESYAKAATDLTQRYWSLTWVEDDNAEQERARRHQREREENEAYWQRQRERDQRQQWKNGASAGTQAGRTDCATLYVTDHAPAEVINAAYKALARKHHPDNGGSVATMQAINAAYDRLKKAGKA